MSLILATLAAVTAPCTMPAGWDKIAARKTQYVVFGEIHGTAQGPKFFGAVACALARDRKRVLIAIEMTARENDDLQAAWRLSPDRFTAAMLADVHDWTILRDGGIATKAMLAMLVRLHAEKTAGRNIDVVAFNGNRDQAQRARFAALPGQAPHEAAQAENIRTAAAAKRYDHVLVLVGNIHARKQPVESRGVTFQPMAMQLAPPSQVTTLNMVFASGTAWNCQPRADVTPAPGRPMTSADILCAERPTKGADAISGPPRMEIGDLPRFSPAAMYDGWFWVGAIASSAPALDAKPSSQP